MNTTYDRDSCDLIINIDVIITLTRTLIDVPASCRMHPRHVHEPVEDTLAMSERNERWI